MKFKNTSDTYGLISKIFHWPMALIMMGLIVLGLYMAQLDPSPDKYALYGLHKSFGLLILWLVGVRILHHHHRMKAIKNGNVHLQ
jgi:cytochrome b561